MLGRHLRALKASQDLDKELNNIGIALLRVRRFGGINAQNVRQCTGDKKPHVLVLVLQQPVFA
jgi:hypothetical protein